MTETEPARDQPEVIDALTQLIRFDTTNWGRGRSTGERLAAEWVAERLSSAGWVPELLTRDDAPDRANVVLRIPGMRRDLPGLLVHGHLDVVPAAPDDWTVDPFAGVVADGYVWGRGAADMKAGLVANLFAYDAVRAAGYAPAAPIYFQSVVEEECTGNGALAALLRGYRADAVIIPEPEENMLVRANVGVLWFKVPTQTLHVVAPPAAP